MIKAFSRARVRGSKCALIMALTMAVAMTACTKPASQTVAGSTDVGPIAIEDISGASDAGATGREVTQENLRSFPETPESEFHVEVLDFGVSITACESKDKVIVVPETIQGMPVVAIGAAGLAELEMEGLVLPDTVSSIDHSGVGGCRNLKYVDFGSGLKTIDSMAFNGCLSLVRAEFPDGMEAIYDAVFYNCEALTEVVIPSSVTVIENGIFSAKTCPNAVVVTPAGSTADSVARELELPVRNE